MDPDDFAARLAAKRTAKKLTQPQLAVRSGLDAGTISRYERRVLRNPESDTVKALAAALECSPSDLMPAPSATVEDARVVLDDDPIDDPVLQAFLATEAGQRLKPSEVETLAAIPRRLGRAKSPDVYGALLSLFRLGFDPEKLIEGEERRRDLEARALAEGRTIVPD